MEAVALRGIGGGLKNDTPFHIAAVFKNSPVDILGIHFRMGTVFERAYRVGIKAMWNLLSYFFFSFR